MLLELSNALYAGYPVRMARRPRKPSRRRAMPSRRRRRDGRAAADAGRLRRRNWGLAPPEIVVFGAPVPNRRGGHGRLRGGPGAERGWDVSRRCCACPRRGWCSRCWCRGLVELARVGMRLGRTGGASGAARRLGLVTVSLLGRLACAVALAWVGGGRRACSHGSGRRSSRTAHRANCAVPEIAWVGVSVRTWPDRQLVLRAHGVVTEIAREESPRRRRGNWRRIRPAHDPS